jgi:hypothetical protein
LQIPAVLNPLSLKPLGIKKKMNVAVLGLFNSGSSALAGVLHRLGFDMGPPFYFDHYESYRFQRQIAEWWAFPNMEERVSRQHRIMVFKRWLRIQKQQGASVIGLKHPQLSLCGDEIIEAWGEETKFIWAYRPLEDSIRGLTKRAWFRDSDLIQKSLWKPVNIFFEKAEHLRIECNDLRSKPSDEIARIIEYLELKVDQQQIESALSYVLPNGLEYKQS